jgi:hypothetical protein
MFGAGTATALYVSIVGIFRTLRRTRSHRYCASEWTLRPSREREVPRPIGGAQIRSFDQ